MAEWEGPFEVTDGADTDRYGWCWTKKVEHGGVECELVASVYDEEGVLADLMVCHPGGYESFAYTESDDPSDAELREWAEEKWEEFKEEYDYFFDSWV